MLWDFRTNKPVLSSKRFDEFVSCFLVEEEKQRIMAASGEGTIQSWDLRMNKAALQSEVYSSELNCLSTVREGTKLVVGSGEGAMGAAGKFGAEVVKWMQGKSFNFWANSVCFSMPGNGEQEVCMCSKDDCNMDRDSARKAAGINLNARSSICNGEECPMADLSKIDDKYDFNSACYTGGEDEIVKCFTSDILFTPEAAALTRTRRSTDEGYELFNIDGVDNSGKVTKGMLAVILGLAVAVIIRG